MKSISMGLVHLILGLRVLGADEVAGEWSAEQRHLQARFVARQDPSEFVVYLELRNTYPHVSTISRKLEIDTNTNITYWVTDEKGGDVEPESAVNRSTFLPGAYNLLLPPDSTLRFPVSLNGGGVWEDKLKLDVSTRKGTWYFQKGRKQVFRLTGVLAVPQVRQRSGIEWWHGKLEIPALELKMPGVEIGN